MANATSFEVRCPYCMSEDATIQMDLNDLNRISCSECEVEFTAAGVVEMLAENLKRWQAVARWVEMAPSE